MIDYALLAAASRLPQADPRAWTLLVSDDLVQAADGEWSEPLQIKFERDENGGLAMWCKTVPAA